MAATASGVINSGSNMAGTEYLSKADAIPMKNQSEDIIDNYDEQTPYQNMILAFELIMQALMTMPVMAYISFALSLIFISLYLLNPFSQVSSSDNHTRKVVRKSQRTHKSTTSNNK